LSKGDKVITHGGVVGTIVGLNDKYAVLKVSDNPSVKMEFLRQAVSQVIKDDGAEKQD
jgi:preprotein translocase subunit YajC